jgi:D-3-phosphoglycerate dehydrogenase / 2-oxoglutarate reductase
MLCVFVSLWYILPGGLRVKTILLDTNVLTECTAILTGAGHAIVGPMPSDTPERRQAFATANAIIIASAWQIDDTALAMAPMLQVVGRPGIGIDNVDTDACTRHGVCVVHTPDAPTQGTAEHAFTLLLALAKQLRGVDADFRAKGWNSRSAYGPGVELKGATLGLVGLGRIGGTVTKMAHGFDMRVIVYDPYITDERARQIGAERKATLHEVLAEADFVSLHSALTPQTRGLIGKAELAMMKPTAYLINCSRGPVVDEAALLEALRARRIAGAGLDVFTVEPTPNDNPLLQLDNVIVTPHIASRTHKGVYDMNVGVAEEVNAVLRGERPRWLANREVWEKRRMKNEE